MLEKIWEICMSIIIIVLTLAFIGTITMLIIFICVAIKGGFA